MDRRVIVLAIALMLGATSAQDWFGVRSGFPLGVTLHYGVADALSDGADLRISGRVVVGGSGVRFGVGVDALWSVYLDGPLTAYVGAGPSLEVGPFETDVGLQGLFGAHVGFGPVGLPRLGVFAEASAGAALSLSRGSARFPTFGAALGVNWFF